MQQIILAEPNANQHSGKHQEACVPGGASHSTHHAGPCINAARRKQLRRELSIC